MREIGVWLSWTFYMKSKRSESIGFVVYIIYKLIILIIYIKHWRTNIETIKCCVLQYVATNLFALRVRLG